MIFIAGGLTKAKEPGSPMLPGFIMGCAPAYSILEEVGIRHQLPTAICEEKLISPGFIISSYSQENQRGTYIASFWIFNFVGSTIAAGTTYSRWQRSLQKY